MKFIAVGLKEKHGALCTLSIELNAILAFY